MRICDIGGWTDTWFYNRGAIFNFTVDLYSYVRIEENTEDKKTFLICQQSKAEACIQNLRQSYGIPVPKNWLREAEGAAL